MSMVEVGLEGLASSVLAACEEGEAGAMVGLGWGAVGVRMTILNAGGEGEAALPAF